MRYNAVPGNSRGQMSTEIKNVYFLETKTLVYITYCTKNSMKVCTPLAYLIFTEARRGLWIPLKLELGVVISHHMVLGIKPNTSEKAASALNF